MPALLKEDKMRMETSWVEYLPSFREEVPHWLATYTKGCELNFDEVFGSNSVYWTESSKPDSGTPIRVFNKAHAAHLFIYASRYYLRDSMRRTFDLKGYDIIDIRKLPIDIAAPKHQISSYRPVVKGEIKCMLYVYQRQAELDATHGAERIALIELAGDSVELYERLFCSRKERKAPLLIAVGDYTGKTPFGCEYKFARIAKGGAISDFECVLERIAFDSDKLPTFFHALGPRTTPWEGYELVEKFEDGYTPNSLGENGRIYIRKGK